MKQIQTGLRIPEQLDKRITDLTKQKGYTKNQFILLLIDLGLKLYDGQVVIQYQAESSQQ